MATENRQLQLSGPLSWQAPDMTFTVTYTDLPPEEHSDDDTYEVLHSGVLKVTTSSSKQTHYFVADIWKSLVADSDHEPGYPKGASPQVLGFRIPLKLPTRTS
jgi:hypothetical protein